MRKFEQDFDLNPCVPGPRMVLKKATGDFFNSCSWSCEPRPAHENGRPCLAAAPTGPYPETKAVIGGFSIIDVPSREEALAWAGKIAVACRCAQEVREIGYDPES